MSKQAFSAYMRANDGAWLHFTDLSSLPRLKRYLASKDEEFVIVDNVNRETLLNVNGRWQRWIDARQLLLVE